MFVADDIKAIDTTLQKAASSFSDERKKIEADATLSAFGKKQKLESLQADYNLGRRKLQEQRGKMIKEIRAVRHSNAFGISGSTTADNIALDALRNEVRLSKTGDLAARLKTATDTTAKIIAAELYDRRQYAPINEHADKFNGEAVKRLQEFDQKYGELRTTSDRLFDRLRGLG